MAPRREERQVKVGDRGEAGRDQEEVARVTPERERGARGPLYATEFAADQGDRVPAAGVGNQPDDGGENRLRQVVDWSVAHGDGGDCQRTEMKMERVAVVVKLVMAAALGFVGV